MAADVLAFIDDWTERIGDLARQLGGALWAEIASSLHGRSVTPILVEGDRCD